MAADVDEGSTVTDFLPAERARGVTIQSAAISFHWPQSPEQGVEHRRGIGSPTTPTHFINLIDTPGHADFTFEVIRSLRILDGAVCILDGVAGVEAQTEKVWSQANACYISKIIYINKLDRDGAAFGKTIKQIALRLRAWPAVCQIPWYAEGNGAFIGIGDLITLQAYRWIEGGDGKNFTVIHVKDLSVGDVPFREEIIRGRVALVELLTEHDDVLVEKYLEFNEDHLAIPPDDIRASLRRCVIHNDSRIVPVFAGASFRNIGVQPLLDAIVALLPSPEESPCAEISLGKLRGTLPDLLDGKLTTELTAMQTKSERDSRSIRRPISAMLIRLEACALAFKVVNDARRGILVYIRVYSGTIRRGAALFNTNLQLSEKAQRILKMYASDSVDISEISAGQIGVIPGLKFARTGDTLISYAGSNPKVGPPIPLNLLQLRPIEAPPSVFSSSIEPTSLSEEKAIANALALLVREDPSLQLSIDEDSGQTILSGMGEFHLEIAGDRLINDYKAKASMGKIEISYRESILKASVPEIYMYERETGGKKSKAGCSATVMPLSNTDGTDELDDDISFSIYEDGNKISISVLQASSPTHQYLDDDSDVEEDARDELYSHGSLQTIYNSLKNGALAALCRGVVHFFPFQSTHVHLTLDLSTQLFGSESTPAALSSAARLATRAALKATAEANGSALLELFMNVMIEVDEASLGAVVNDISSARGGQILSLDDDVAIPNEEQHIDLAKVYAPPDPFGSSVDTSQGHEFSASKGSRRRSITARVPLREMVGYLKHLRQITGGRGTFVMSADRFEKVTGQREKVILKELKGF